MGNIDSPWGLAMQCPTFINGVAQTMAMVALRGRPSIARPNTIVTLRDKGKSIN